MTCSYPYIAKQGVCNSTFYSENKILVYTTLFPLGVGFGTCTLLYTFLWIKLVLSEVNSKLLFLSNTLYLASSVLSIYVIFRGLGTRTGLNSSAGKSDYFLICLGINFMFDGSVFSNLIIALSILPEDFINNKLQRVTLVTGIGLVTLMFAFIVLIFGDVTTTVTSYYRSLVVMSVLVLSLHIYHFNSILNAVIDMYGTAIPSLSKNSLQKKVVLHEPSLTTKQRFICEQIRKIQKFKSKITIAVAAIVAAILVLFTVPGLFENSYLLYFFTVLLYIVGLTGLATYFWLNHKIFKQKQGNVEKERRPVDLNEEANEVEANR